MTLPGWVWSYLRPYRARVAVIGALSVFEVGLAALAPWPLKLVVDNVLSRHPLPAFLAGPVTALAGTNPGTVLLVIVVTGLVLQIATEAVLMVHTQIQVDT